MFCYSEVGLEMFL